ncbi:hypothetical protein Ndes2526B_g00504 [Nannochloris sp. 'desiccata']
MFENSERSPVLQKDETPMAGQVEFLDKFNKVEALVADILSITNCTAASAASAAVDSAVRRARQKAKILPSMGSGLVLAALDEVALDVSSLPEASVANAAIMRQLTEDMLRNNTTPTTPHQDAPAPPSSVRSVRGDQIPPNPESLESAGAGGVVGASASEQPPSSDTQPHPSSVMSTIQEPGSGAAAATSTVDEELESTAGTPDATSIATAHRIMDPLRQFIAETCSAEQDDPECALIRRNLRLKKPKSGDMKFAREVDFDSCVSPRPHTPSSPCIEKLGTPRVRGACLEFGLDATGRKPLKVEPMYSDVDQYSPMTPHGDNNLSDEKDKHAAGSSSLQRRQRHWRSRGAAMGTSGTTSPKSLSQGASPRGGGDWGGLRVGGMNVCEAGAPPGLLPTARVEGSKECAELGEEGGERVGDPVPTWFDPVKDEEIGELSSSKLPGINDVTHLLVSRSAKHLEHLSKLGLFTTTTNVQPR